MLDVIAAAFLVAGAAFMLLSGIGLLRMPDLYTRMSATSKAASLGAGLALLAVAIHHARLDVSVRAVAAIVFVFLTVPVAAHMVGRAAYRSGIPLWHQSVADELTGKYDPDGVLRGRHGGRPDPLQETAPSDTSTHRSQEGHP